MDLNLPERLGATYVAEDGHKKTPVMLHRALFGSLERFAGILIEHYSGHLPLWLSPKQIVVATITSDTDDYAKEVRKKLLNSGLRVDLDLRNEKIGYKISEHSTTKIPIILAVGKKEEENKTVSVRRLGNKDTKNVLLEELTKDLQKESLSPIQ